VRSGTVCAAAVAMQTAVKAILIVVLKALRFIAFFLVRRFDSANPALTDMDRNDRLYVQDVLRVVMRPIAFDKNLVSDGNTIGET
jgi:hypothetical protein